MLHLTLFIVCGVLTVWTYFHKPLTLGDKLRIKEEENLFTAPDFFGLELPFLSKVNYFKELSNYAERHGAYTSAGHIAFVAFSLSVAAFILVLLLVRNIFLAVVGAVAVLFLGGRLYTSWFIGRQRELISSQMGDALLSLTSSVRAGKILLEAIKITGEDLPDPLGSEFTRVYEAVCHGAEDLTSALQKMLKRTGNHHMLEKVVYAMTTVRQTGGNIARALEGVGKMLDNEIHTKEFAKAHSSHGKMVALVFNLVFALILFNTNRVMPGAAAEYFLASFGKQVLLFVCLAAIVLGWILIFRLLNSVFDV